MTSFSDFLKCVIRMSGLDDYEIADCLGVTRNSVGKKIEYGRISLFDFIKICQLTNAELIYRSDKGELHILKMLEETLAEDKPFIDNKNQRNFVIAEMREQGYTLAEIGKRFGISKETVRLVIKDMNDVEGGSR